MRYGGDAVTVRAFSPSGRLKAAQRRPAREAPLAISDIYLLLDVSATDLRDHWE